MAREGIMLGHLVSKRGIEMEKPKTEVIEKLLLPTSIRGVRIFLGQFYRLFIRDLSKIFKLLTGLLMKNAEFIFDEQCLKSFNKLKGALIFAPIMQPPY